MTVPPPRPHVHEVAERQMGAEVEGIAVADIDEAHTRALQRAIGLPSIEPAILHTGAGVELVSGDKCDLDAVR